MIPPAPRPIVTIAQARASGLKRYYTGTACKHGHVAERYTASYICVKCHQLRRRANRNIGHRTLSASIPAKLYDEALEALMMSHGHHLNPMKPTAQEQARIDANKYIPTLTRTIEIAAISGRSAADAAKSYHQRRRTGYYERAGLVASPDDDWVDPELVE